MNESNATPSSVGIDRGDVRTHEVVWRHYLEKTAGGDDRAFASFYDESSRLVHSVAMRFLADQADADEVTVDVFTQVWRSASVFDAKRGTVTAWLVTMARSRANSYSRVVAGAGCLADCASRSNVPPWDCVGFRNIAGFIAGSGLRGSGALHNAVK